MLGRLVYSLFSNRGYSFSTRSKTLVAREAEVYELFRQVYSHKEKRIYSFYCSDYDRIIVDEHLMLIPVDDRMATRSHAVFDTIYIKKMHIINMQQHIERLLKSAKTLDIQSPLSPSQIQCIINLQLEKIVDLSSEAVRQFLQKGGLQNELKHTVFGVRINLSSGYGDFGIASEGKKPVFYATVFEPFFGVNQQRDGVNEFIVKEVNSNISEFTHSKTVNYAENALMANESKRRGGYQGVKCTKDKVILEASVANVAFVFGKEFATPRLQTVIEGTTLKKILPKLKQMVKEGTLIDKISFRDITVDEALTATEMMVVGGDKIVPVLNLNNCKIRQSKGPVASSLQMWYEQAIQTGTPVVY